VTRSGGERNERIRFETAVFNDVRQISTFKMVSSYHGVYSFVFVALISGLA
jgi:hypothetical protein